MEKGQKSKTDNDYNFILLIVLVNIIVPFYRLFHNIHKIL